ncbi:MAG: hypothetical protein ACXABY_35330 [Candidatus Thorarchaeota archaeon]|jgi:hypothetical protein
MNIIDSIVLSILLCGPFFYPLYASLLVVIDAVNDKMKGDD